MMGPVALRQRVVTLLLVSGLGGVVACGCRSSASSPPEASPPSASSWSGDASEDLREGGADGASDLDAAPPAAPPAVYIVNASPDAPPLRFCLGLAAGDGGAVVVAGGLPASPDQAAPGAAIAGLYPGLAGVLPDHGLDLDTLSLHLFALDATNPAVAANAADGGAGPEGGLEAPCEALIGGDGLGAATDAGPPLVRGRDYFDVASLPAGMLGHGTTWLVAVTGCMPGEPGAAALCPVPYDLVAGNLSARIWQLDTATTVDPGALGVQVAQASSEWDNLARASAGAVSAGFLVPSDGGGALDAVVLGGDAGDAMAPASPETGYISVPIAAGLKLGDLAPGRLASAAGLAYGGSTAFVAQVTSAADAAVLPTPRVWPLPAVQALSWPGAVPDEAGVLRDGAGFVFVLLGNPAVSGWYVNPTDGGPSSGPDAGGVFNGHAPHVLALPVAHP